MKVAFVRHGHAESNVMDPEKKVGSTKAALTERGREQILSTATIIGNLITTSTVYCSPYLRTRQSAHILATELGVDIETDERLQEISKGEWHGLSVGKVIELEADIEQRERHTFRPPGGENWSDVGSRVAAFVEEKAQTTEDDILIVSHDHPIRLGIGFLLNRPVTTWEDLMVENGSITIINQNEYGWELDSKY